MVLGVQLLVMVADKSRINPEMQADDSAAPRFATLSAYVTRKQAECLNGYRANPDLVEEQHNRETSILSGGYAYRQMFELIQNAADAIHVGGDTGGHITVELTRDYLRVSNSGAPLDQDGIKALLQADTSSKRDNQIGRFGIGFKSLLNLGGQVDILSRSIGLRFDPDKTRKRIRRELDLLSDAPAPGMRLAECLDPAAPESLFQTQDYASSDTIVTAELDTPEAFSQLENEIDNFPAQFLLFLNADVELKFIVNGETRREIMKLKGQSGKGFVDIQEDEDVRTWRLFKSDVVITDDAALRDATQMQRRDTVPLSWAVPTTGRDEEGRFWAFFPTNSANGLKGILNAPWKLNSDRTAVIAGPWNTALMEVAADYIAKWMSDLATDEDPGAVLDAYPRKLDRDGDLPGPLVTRLAAHIAKEGRLPDARGRLQLLERLKRHPVADYKTILEWAKISDEPSGTLLHPSCYRKKDRISRLDNVLRQEDKIFDWLSSRSVRAWFDAHDIETVAASAQAVITADNVPRRFEELDAKIIQDMTGILREPTDCAIYEDNVRPGTLYPVASELSNDVDIRERLLRLGVKVLGRDVSERELENALRDAPDRDTSKWSHFWELAARTENDVLLKFLNANIESLRLRTVSGDWVFREFYAQGLADAPPEAALDEAYFDGLGLKLPPKFLGLPKLPENFRSRETRTIKDRHSNWLYNPFRNFCERETGTRPRGNPRLSPETRMPPGSTLAWLHRSPSAFSDQIMAHLLSQCALAGDKYKRATLQTLKNSHQYPKPNVVHPVWLLVCKVSPVRLNGVCISGRSLSQSVAALIEALDFRNSGGAQWVLQLRAETLKLNADLGVSVGLHEWSDLSPEKEPIKAYNWPDLLQAAEVLTEVPRKLVGLWNEAASAGVTPQRVPTINGPKSPSDAHVTPSFEHAVAGAGRGIFFLSEEACRVWEAGGANRLPTKPEWKSEPTGEDPLPLLSAWPELGRLTNLLPDLRRVVMSRVENLQKTLGPSITPHPVHFDPEEWTLLLDVKAVGGEGREATLRILLNAMRDKLMTGQENCRWQQNISDLARRCCESIEDVSLADEGALETIALRIADLANNDVAALLSLLPRMTEDLVPWDATATHVAELVLASYGPATLGAMLKAGLLQESNPPARFGGRKALDYVRRHGLPIEFATSSSARLNAHELVRGPSKLPPLHDYQEDINQSVEALLSQGPGRRRAVISLPTGGGKTRVAVQSAVSNVLTRDDREASVLWIAQGEELCEQAVQCFIDVWSAVGTPGKPLKVVRFWGGYTQELQLYSDGPTVIVATIDTLRSRMEQSDTADLSKVGLVIVDECHAAITKSYTELWNFLGLQTGRQAAMETEIPVLGLSATPWRGRNDVDSQRLANRFDNRWLPKDQADLHKTLRDRGVLCPLTYSNLDYGKTVDLTADQREHIDRFKTIPNSVLDKLATDDDRNKLIVDAVTDTQAKSVLLFANSVEHARTLAIMLELQGQRAAAISHDTDTSARRFFIKEFGEGRIRVLSNYGVLTTGFDAPKTDLIVISRPVMSPVLYMQMVGRGMRGPQNGGTDRCEVITVNDNLREYSDKLAHHFCKQYFS